MQLRSSDIRETVPRVASSREADPPLERNERGYRLDNARGRSGERPEIISREFAGVNGDVRGFTSRR